MVMRNMNNRIVGWCASASTISLCVLTALHFGVSPAFAQSSGSGGGSFSAAYLIPTVACSATSSDGTLIDQCSAQGGGPKVLFGNIKTPSASSKNVLVMATLESSLLTATTVASKGGNNSSSTASGAVVVKPHV